MSSDAKEAGGSSGAHGRAKPRVCVTGLGLVTALGPDVETTWQAVRRGERGIGKVGLFSTEGYRTSLGAEVRGLPTRAEDTWSRAAEMALMAAGQAMESGRVQDARKAGKRVGLVVGATTGGMFETERLLAVLSDPGEREGAKVEAWRKLLSNPICSITQWIDDKLGPFQRTRTLSSACSSGANAVLVGASWLLLDLVDLVVVGGADGLCRLTQAGFGALSASDPELCRPFDVARRGLNLGEGAGFMALELEGVARERGARVLCEVAGWAVGSEAHHITNPDATGKTPARLLTEALARAGLTPRELDYVNAHGTATPLNDSMECAGIVAALGEEAGRVPVSSSKAQLGHTLAAAGAIEAVLTVLCLRDQVVIPTAGLTHPDPLCAVRHVFRTEPARIRAAASNSFGFGGMDTVLVVAEPGLAHGGAPERRSVVFTGASALTPAGLASSPEVHRLLDAPLGEEHTVALDWSKLLHVGRARRLDRLSRLATVVVERALGPLLPFAPDAPHTQRIGLLLGNAWGNLDASAAFLRRVFDKGARLASPADFPNLVPSSPVGHIAIYLGLTGPSFALVDFAVSGEASFGQGFEMVACGEVDAVCVGGVEEKSDIVERVLTHVFVGDGEARAPRAEGAAAVTLASEAFAIQKGLPVLARVLSSLCFRERSAPSLADLAAPGERSLVLARRDDVAGGLVARSSWAHVPRRAAERATGAHESAGAILLAAAVSLVHAGVHDRVLVIGESNGNGYAVVVG